MSEGVSSALAQLGGKRVQVRNVGGPVGMQSPNYGTEGMCCIGCRAKVLLEEDRMAWTCARAPVGARD